MLPENKSSLQQCIDNPRDIQLVSRQKNNRFKNFNYELCFLKQASIEMFKKHSTDIHIQRSRYQHLTIFLPILGILRLS